MINQLLHKSLLSSFMLGCGCYFMLSRIYHFFLIMCILVVCVIVFPWLFCVIQCFLFLVFISFFCSLCCNIIVCVCFLYFMFSLFYVFSILCSPAIPCYLISCWCILHAHCKSIKLNPRFAQIKKFGHLFHSFDNNFWATFLSKLLLSHLSFLSNSHFAKITTSLSSCTILHSYCLLYQVLLF